MVTCKHAVNLKSNDSEFLVSFKFSGVSSVADPDDLQMGGWGGECHNIFFRPLEPQFGLKIRGWGGGAAAEGGLLPLDPPLKLNFSTSTSAIL